MSHLLRVYADLANDLTEAGFGQGQAQKIGGEVRHYEQVRMEIKLASGDYIDLKKYEPAMRMLIDRYIAAEESEKLSNLDNMTLVDLIVNSYRRTVSDVAELFQLLTATATSRTRP